ncbi:DUF4124 domain-containing protein [Rhodoferax sp. PAMC 29310]|uniref:DUF4124 domain-containing protein n=1 Tax=Rhodoferax sp. PAMC 29310 TaxID=2822760 RepID=UPI001B32B206|nr:DUF4124 domain-containing protein [Rhodoferax sp. PAMC 29310]
MHTRLLISIFFIALAAVSTGASAQKIYKCGTTYTQQPCPDGAALPATPVPDVAQRSAADQATRRDTLTADRMEKSRLIQEKKEIASNSPDIKRPVPKSATQEKPVPAPKKNTFQGKKEEFRAVVPGTTPLKKHTKKKADSSTDS